MARIFIVLALTLAGGSLDGVPRVHDVWGACLIHTNERLVRGRRTVRDIKAIFHRTDKFRRGFWWHAPLLCQPGLQCIFFQC
jgi:hypothetical protein